MSIILCFSIKSFCISLYQYSMSKSICLVFFTFKRIRRKSWMFLFRPVIEFAVNQWSIKRMWCQLLGYCIRSTICHLKKWKTNREFDAKVTPKWAWTSCWYGQSFDDAHWRRKLFSWGRENKIKTWWFVLDKLAQQMIDPVAADSMLRKNVKIARYVFYTSAIVFEGGSSMVWDGICHNGRTR